MKWLVEWLIRKPQGFVDTYFDARERRQVLQAVVVGVAVWGVVFSLELAVHEAFHQLKHLVHLVELPVPLLLLPIALVGALVTATLVRVRGAKVHYRSEDGLLHPLADVEGDGLERAIALYFAAEPAPERALLGEQGVDARWRLPTFSLALRKMAATLSTLGTGGSGGLEASVTLIGESVAAGLFKPRPLAPVAERSLRPFERLVRWWRASDPDDLQTAQLCGIAAAVSTLLGAPFAGAFFAVEVMYRRRPIVDRLIQALIAALTAFFLSHFAGAGGLLFEGPFPRPPVYEGPYYLALLAVAVSVAAVAIYFRWLRGVLDHLFHDRIGGLYRRHLLGAGATSLICIAVAGLLALVDGFELFPLGDHPPEAMALVLGSGDEVLEQVVAGEVVLGVAGIALVGRLHASLVTITSGGAAGLLFPTLFFGAMVATLWSGAFPEYPAVHLVAPAMCASLVSIANVPLAAILLVVEVFGTAYTVPALFMLVVASTIAYDNYLYRTQREAFDGRQVLPGFSVRRIPVPPRWEGSTLRDLALRSRHGVTVIGMIDRTTTPEGAYDQRMVLNPPADQPLTMGDVLVVLGEDDRLDAFVHALDGDLAGDRALPSP
jgi:CIC family chloride channel protein